MSQSLQDRRVLVIGRGSGIARAAAVAARAAGAQVVVAGRNAETLAARYDDSAITVEHVDITDEATIAALGDRLGSIDHVISTASARARGRVADLDPDVVLASFRTKVIGPILLAKHLAPRMPSDGSFVFFSGQSAVKHTPGMLAVGATNGAVDVAVRGLAVELAPIRVNAISPGTIDTGAYDALGEQGKNELFTRLAEHSPARRVGAPDDIADAVLFALTNTFLTGVSLSVDGGEVLV
jgi:NAD(P)-dependent dehydrogenase (short-subunit alcohol dehydrogenase family)